MRIVNMLFNIRCFGLKFSTAAAGIIVLFFCSPLWGYFPDLHQQRLPVSFPNTSKDPIAKDQLIRLDNGGLAKRGSSNQYFQQWQDLSPDEQEKMRKKYKEWQSLPPQTRKLYKQLFRQWQHLPAKERKQLQEDLNNWENLSPRQRNSIRRRFKN
jgi:mRNA-degrading endonuclease RelE of RelBE toxin-antitoxin system